MEKVAPASRMRCLARLTRWAIVASGTKKALAISAVVRPPTALSVRAICDGGVKAGWQHSSSRIRVSSRSGSGSFPGSRLSSAGGDPKARRSSRCAPGTLAPYLVDQAAGGDGDQPGPGVIGCAVVLPVPGRGDERFLNGVFAKVKRLVTA